MPLLDFQMRSYGYRFDYFTSRPNSRPIVVGFEIYEHEARIVRLIFTWYVRDDESGKPLATLVIAKKLETMQIPTPGSQGCITRKGRGIWSYSAVATIIKNETYSGIRRYGCRAGALRKRLPLEEQIAVTVPAIVERETWQAAQARLAYNNAMSKRNSKHDYLLRGLIKCAWGGAG